MTGSKNNKRKKVTLSRTTPLPAGVKVVAPPKSAARRKLLSTPDIETSGGHRTVHPLPAAR
jgi:hypothetical protein